MADNFEMNDGNVVDGEKVEVPQEQQQVTPQQLVLMAVESHFQAKRSRAVANLNNYMSSAVGVGEHPDIVEECIKLIETVDNAESVLQTLGRIIQ